MDHQPVDEALFRRAMSHFASGVTVVTSAHGDDVAGTTVSAFSSLSLAPPLILVCLDETSATRALIERSGVFAVNVLASDQQALSDRFAQRRKEGDAHQFDGVPWRAASSKSPLLEGAHVSADCRVVAVHDGGDHRIYVGRVETLGFAAGSHPLVYHGGRYRRLSD